VDVTDPEREPAAALGAIRKELEKFSAELVQKPALVVANKLDAVQAPERVEALRAEAEAEGFLFHTISAVAGDGLTELRRLIAEQLKTLEPAEPVERTTT
jgi:GTP-binding protein